MQAWHHVSMMQAWHHVSIGNPCLHHASFYLNVSIMLASCKHGTMLAWCKHGTMLASVTHAYIMQAYISMLAWCKHGTMLASVTHASMGWIQFSCKHGVESVLNPCLHPCNPCKHGLLMLASCNLPRAGSVKSDIQYPAATSSTLQRHPLEVKSDIQYPAATSSNLYRSLKETS
jgi:hypothetical protein